MSIAEERIEILYSKSEQRYRDGREELSRRYIRLADRISEKTQETVPEKLKNRTCSNCSIPLLPGLNCSVRVSEGETIYTCECGEKNKIILQD